MDEQYDTANGGWIDSALTWWLGSANNTWGASNPCTLVTVLGNRDPKHPWANASGAKDVGNYLRTCDMVGLSISWPTTSLRMTTSEPFSAQTRVGIAEVPRGFRWGRRGGCPGSR